MRRQYSLGTSGRNPSVRQRHFPQTRRYRLRSITESSAWYFRSEFLLLRARLRILSVGRGRRWEVRDRAENCIVRILLTCNVQQSKKGWVATEGNVQHRNKIFIQSFDKKLWRKDTSWTCRVKRGSSLVQWRFEDQNSSVDTVINPILNSR